MKPLFVGIQLGALACVCFFSYFLGPSVYLEIVTRVKDYGFTSFSPSFPVNGGLINDQLTKESEGNKLEHGEGNGKAKQSVLDSPETEEPGGSNDPTADYISNDNLMLTKPVWQKPPAGSSLPPRKDFSLTKDMVESRATNNVIVVTFANHAFLDFVLNWVRHLTNLKVVNLLVGAMDTQILEALYWEGVPVFDMGSEMNTIDVGWGSPTFHKMGREKVILVNQFLAMGFELLMCDTDMVWTKNPLPYFARFPAADVLVSSDEVASSVNDDRLEVWERAHGAYNIGIFIWRPSAVARKFASEWSTQLLAHDEVWDQNGFNDLMRMKMGPALNDGSGVFYAYNGTLKLGVLPVSIFCSGHAYFVQALHEQLNLEPYAVHTTFQFAGTAGKRHRLREAKLFLDKPDYYDTPGGYLSFRSSIPDELLTGGDHLSIENHFKLINYQIKQIRDALAIASTLNRTLVMPKLWCRLDRLWFGHPGVLPGTKTRQPFLCPLDHVFEVNQMLEHWDEVVYGPTINFREYSFLENPRFPKQVKASKLQVKLCKRGSLSCGEEIEGASKKFKLPRNSTDQEIWDALSRYKDIKVLDFAAMDMVFNGFVDKKMEGKFRARVKRYTGIWCCAPNLQPGDIWYDIFWDEKPN